MNEQITGLASLGRYEDNRIAHVADGEMIVPPLAISLATKRQIFRDMLNQGINPANYIVGSSMGINPTTGLPEFFLKKLVKAVVKPVKKIVKSKLFKKIAPLAGVIAAPFTGGLSAALIGGIGGLASGKGLKGGILGALGGFGASSALGAIKGAGGLGSALKGLGSKISSKFGGIKSLFGGKGGLGSLLGGGSGTGGITSLLGSSQNPLMTLAKSAISGDSNPLKTLALNRMGRSSNPLLRMVSDAYGQQVSDPNDPDAINREYDIYNQNLMKQFYDQQMKNAAALAVPAGALSYYSARKEADNPLQDVRDTIRPDLRMADVYGQGGFDLGFRGYYDGGPVRNLQDNPLLKLRRALPSFNRTAKFLNTPVEDVAKDLRSSLYDIYQITQSPEEIGAFAARAQKDFEETMAEAQELFNDGTQPIKQFIDRVRQGYMTEKEKEMAGYSEGGEVDDVVDNFLSQSKFGGNEISTFVKGNPRFTELLRSLILAPTLSDMLSPDEKTAMAEAYDRDLREANKLGLIQLASGYDYLPARKLYNNPFRQKGYAEGGEVLDMRFGGESIGPGTGTSDDIPAMLSDGEFVMTASANNGIGGYKITKEKDSLTLIPSGKPNRKKGAQNMMNLMKTFEKYNEGKA